MEYFMKEVEFNKCCKTCKFKDTEETEDPCDECLDYPVNEYSHKPINYKKSNTDYGYFESLKKNKEYLYSVKYNELDYENAFEYYKTQIALPLGGCSSIRNGNWYGRQFDWTYDENAEFIVSVPRIKNKYASIGIAGGFKQLTNEFVKSGAYSPLYKLLPFQMRDGINEHGVVINENVVPSENHVNVSIPTKGNRVTISCLMLIRYVLDNFATATDAVNFIREHMTVYFPDYLHEQSYELHYMIADEQHTYIVEFVDNATVIIDVSDKPYMTNFYINGVEFNQNGKVYTPETQDAQHNAILTNHITEHGSGLERYNYIVDNYSTTNTKTGMRSLLNNLKYTKAYSTSQSPSNPYWYTEFVGSMNLTVASPINDFSEVVNTAGNYYLHRSRETGLTWQTVHSVIYNIADIAMYVIAQENGPELIFSLE